jgi:uncharacterized protein (DUF1800 family)
MPLTPDDKQWIAEQFKLALIAELPTKAEVEKIATKADLDAVQTKLLTAFRAWASRIESVESRLNSFGASLRATDAEYERLSYRIKRIEDRLGITELSS